MTADANASLPRNWTCAELGQIADVQLGKMLDKKRTNGTPLRYLRNVNVRWGSIDTSDLLEMPFKERELERYSLLPGDVLVCEGGEPGRAAVWQADDPTIKYQKALHRVRMSGEILPHWLVFHLYFDAQRGALTNQLTGTTIKHFPREAFREYPLRVAPIPEQARIVAALESYFTRLDDAVATLERVQRNLKRYRASVLKTAVEGRLVPTEAELARAEGRSYEPASVLLTRILAERRRRWEEAELAKMTAKGKAPKDDKWKAKYVEPVAPDTSELPELPEGWCWASIEQLASSRPRSIQSGPFGSNLLHSEFRESGRLVVGIDNVQDGYFSMGSENRISESKFQTLEKYRARAGDVLVTVMATIGRCCVIPDDLEPAIITKHVYRISSHPAVVSPRYLHLAIWGGPIVRDQMFGKAQGQTRPGLNGTIIKQLCIPLPPRPEQDRIVIEAERLLSIGEESASVLMTTAHRSARLRQSILKWAFEGRLVDQDPTDEPASVLLERIRAERASATDTPPRRARRANARARKS